MVLQDVFEAFVEESPVSVMIRGTLENAVPAQFVDELFEKNAQRQYTRQLLFSDVVDLMGGVVCQVFPSVHAAFQRKRERFNVSRRAVYHKVNHVEPGISRQLVRQTAERLGKVAARLKAPLPSILPGYRVKILDGNHLAATEHRIKELRTLAAGPLPGQALVVLDPQSRLVIDVFPCEDAHAQERSLLVEVLDTVDAGDVWIEDRNFCTSLFVFQVAISHAFFIVRQHATNVRWEAIGELRKVGRTDTGTVYEQRVRLLDDWSNTLDVRRITIKLDQPTEDGDTQIHLLSNLPKKVKATRIANAYRERWSIEGVFGELATALHSEISSLGYPPAALFGFCLALLAFNVLSVVKTAMGAVHGRERIEQGVSGYYLAQEISGVMRGMMIAIPAERWSEQFANLTPTSMAAELKRLAKKVNLLHFQKHRRGPKKPPPKRIYKKRTPHVSTARILEQRNA